MNAVYNMSALHYVIAILVVVLIFALVQWGIAILERNQLRERNSSMVSRMLDAESLALHYQRKSEANEAQAAQAFIVNTRLTAALAEKDKEEPVCV